MVEVFKQQYGLYIDGALGEDYFIRMLKDLLRYAWRVSGEELGSLLKDLDRPEDAAREPLETALSYLQSVTSGGLMWIMEPREGSLMLLPEAMIRRKPDDDETKDLSCLTDPSGS